MNIYFKFKLATEYIIPLSIFALFVIVTLIRVIKEIIRETRIKKFLSPMDMKGRYLMWQVLVVMYIMDGLGSLTNLNI